MNHDIDDRHFSKGPWLLLLWGAPAAGKTTLARNLLHYWAEQGMVVPHLSSDSLNRALIGEAFQKELRPVIYNGLMTMAREILTQGKCLVLDGTFLHQETRNRIREMAERQGASQLHVQVTCPLALRLERNAKRGTADRVPDEWIRNAHYQADYGRKDATLVVDTSSLHPLTARDQILQGLGLRLRRRHGMLLKSRPPSQEIFSTR